MSGSADWPRVGSSLKLTWQCLLLCPHSSDLQQSWLLDLVVDWEWALVWYNLSISSSRATTADNAFWCASHILPRLRSTESSSPQWGFLPLEEWEVLCLGSVWIPEGSFFSGWQLGTAADTSSRAAGSPGRDPSSLVACKPPDKSRRVPHGWFLALPAQWQAHLPLVSAGAYAASGLGRWSILLPSALQRQHEGTFRVESPGSVGCLQPTGFELPETSLHPLPFWAPAQVSAPQQISTEPLYTFPVCCGLLLPSICDNYRGIKEQMSGHDMRRYHTLSLKGFYITMCNFSWIKWFLDLKCTKLPHFRMNTWFKLPSKI